MIFVVCLILAIFPVWLAANGQGYRGAYFAVMIGAGVIGFLLMEMATVPLNNATATPAEVRGEEFIDAYFPFVAFAFFALAVGTAIGGAAFRTHQKP